MKKIFYYLLGLSACALVYGCKSPEDEAKPTYYRSLGEPCNEIDNCSSEYICSAGICRILCHHDDDCVSKKQHCDDGNFCTDNPGGSCRTGWSGVNCDICADKYYGPNCQLCPDCGPHGTCKATLTGDGTCQCDIGWTGPACAECDSTHFGSKCEECPDCGSHGTCDVKEDGSVGCLCNKGFTGSDCTSCVDDRLQGEGCDECKYGITSNGECSSCVEASTSSMQDGSGKQNGTICIDGRYWTAANMTYTPAVGKVYYVDDNQANTATYGLLYDFKAAQAVCPATGGWRLPTDEEYNDLIKYAKAKSPTKDEMGALMAKSDLWSSAWSNREDAIGFGALPAANLQNGNFSKLGSSAYFWTGTTKGATMAYAMSLGYRLSPGVWYYVQSNGYSVRCVKHECADLRFTGPDCDKCKNPQKSFGSGCSDCTDPLMTGDNCVICQNGNYGSKCTEAYGYLTDSANNRYKTVKIDGKTWMAENMRYEGSGITCYAAYYNNVNSSLVDCTNHDDCALKYGCLYTWNDAKKVCPSGWHLPTEAEFKSLLEYVQNMPEGYAALRAPDYANGNNATGFGALHAGYKSTENKYTGFGEYVYFWADDESSTQGEQAFAMYVSAGDPYVGSYSEKTEGHSVRCIMD